MKEYKIRIEIDEQLYEYIDEIDKDIHEDVKELERLAENGVTVSTLDEYFALLKKIDDLTGGQYHIYNNGTWVACFDD